jgi:aminomethyltransferase
MIDVLKRTPLYEEHVAAGGKMVPFAGYEMPVQYPTGITAEHRAVREGVGLFDVSHMGEFVLSGPQALGLIQHISINDASQLEVGQAQYSAMCTESGGVVDDMLIYRFPDRYMLVVNASNLDKDWAWVETHAQDFEVDVEDISDRTGLLAVQGPRARDTLQPLAGINLDSVRYYRFVEGEVCGVPTVVSGTGYTGEDGFELYVDAADTQAVWRALLGEGESFGILPTGLGARDSLRLEMGYALYGHELDDSHTPLESGLGWVTKLDADFVGRDALVAQKAEGLSQRLVGLVATERGFPRSGYGIVSEGEVVGTVTSGTMSPSLGVGVAMGYVPTALSAKGTPLHIDSRGRPFAAVVSATPFYTTGSIRR